MKEGCDRGTISNLVSVELATCVSAKRERLKEVRLSHMGLANQSAGFDLNPGSPSERSNGDRSEGWADSPLSWIAEWRREEGERAISTGV